MSSNKYVPPHKRGVSENKFDVLDQSDSETEKPKEEFPALVTTTNVVQKNWNGKKKFSDMAVQFSKRSEEQKNREEIEKNVNEYHYNNNLPQFHNIGKFIEPEDDEFNQVKDTPYEEDGWINVKNSKIRKVKNMEEIANRPPTPEEKTMWNDDEDEDSYWKQD